MSANPPGEPRPAIAVFSHGELIGDALYKIPFVRALREAFPDAWLVWITTDESALATRLRPLTAGLIDEFRSPCGMGTSPWQLLGPRFFDDHFQVFLDTQSVIWRTLMAKRIRHDLFISPAANFRFSDRRPPLPYAKPAHIVDRLLDMLALACGHRPTLPETLGLPLPADLEEKAARLLPPGPVYVALAPGAGGRIKCWPLDRFIELGRAIAARGWVPVYIVGPAEEEWLPAIRDGVPQALFPEQATDVWGGEFTPLRTIALARRCRMAVSNDSGISHMLGIADIPLLVLYGPTDATKFRPAVSRCRTLSARDFGGPDMRFLPLDAVVGALDGMVA
ncbi:MAG TPA: glycosyltransferase family 9 protein [Azospirillaceae bacterium]|nr:glycosyltransferase family 9 protein [Azospirillaceae bacterium]